MKRRNSCLPYALISSSVNAGSHLSFGAGFPLYFPRNEEINQFRGNKQEQNIIYIIIAVNCYFPRIMEKTSCGGILGRTAGTVITVHRRGCTGLTGYQRRPHVACNPTKAPLGLFAHCQVIRKFMSFILTMKTNCVIVSNMKFGFDFGIYMKLDAKRQI